MMEEAEELPFNHAATFEVSGTGRSYPSLHAVQMVKGNIVRVCLGDAQSVAGTAKEHTNNVH